jgi:hypothetical protein
MIAVPAGAGTDLSNFLAVTARILLEKVGEGGAFEHAQIEMFMKKT